MKKRLTEQFIVLLLNIGNLGLCDSVVAIPVYLRHSISIREGSGGKLDITIGPKQTMGKTVCSFCTSPAIISLSYS